MPANLRQVADAAGVSLATASYALRGAPRIPEPTAKRVRDAARRLGYTGNARFSEMMAHFRSGRKGSPGERLGLLWADASAARGHLRSEVMRGARLQAARRGYGLEECTLGRDGIDATRATGILEARGIQGLLLEPLQAGERAEIELPWARFAAVVIGAAEWPVPLARAAHHHFDAMRLALRNLSGRFMKLACWLDPVTDNRAHKGWSAAWLSHSGPGSRSRLLLESPGECLQGRLLSWINRQRPDAVLTGSGGQEDALREAGWTGPVFLLDRRRGDASPGIRQGYGSIAAQAVDLAITLLQGGDLGPPRHPRTLLFQGVWENTAR